MSVSPSASTNYTLTAMNSAGSSTYTAYVTVLAPSVATLTASPTSAPNGSNTTVTLTATLSSAAPPGGITVNFSTATGGGWGGSYGLSATSAAVQAGQYTATITGNVQPTSGAGSVIFSATTTGGSSASAMVTVGAASASPGVSGSGTQTAPGSPGVSLSLTPYVIASGGWSVLRWDTSGASSVTVSGFPFPSLSGSLNVNPSQTTTYTVTATNNAGTTTQSVTLTVDATLGSGTSGASAFTPGTPVSAAAGSFTPASIGGFTIPVSTIAGITLPGIPAIPGLPGLPGIPGTAGIPGIPGLSIPPLTIPGLSIPPVSLPIPSLPGLSLPGDLKIGIPGIGSIGIPTGWLSQLIAAAINPASIAQQVATFNAAQFNGLQTFNAGQAVTNAVNNGTYTLQQIQTVNSANTNQAINSSAAQTQSVITQTSSVLQGTLQNQTFAINQTAQTTQNTVNTNFTNMLSAGPSGLLTQLFQYLFIPDQATLQNFQGAASGFFNWGPVAFAESLATLFTPPPAGSAAVAGAPQLPFARQAPRLETGEKADLSHARVLGGVEQPFSSPPTPAPVYGVPFAPAGTNLAIPLMTPVQSTACAYSLTTGFTCTPTVTWTNTGQSVPFDFTPMTNAPFWPFFRLMEGAGVYLAFGLGVMRKVYPRLMF